MAPIFFLFYHRFPSGAPWVPRKFFLRWTAEAAVAHLVISRGQPFFSVSIFKSHWKNGIIPFSPTVAAVTREVLAMPNSTRQTIKDVFLTLLEQRPLSRITVKDIVEGCGINRNSFYYHFEDLPALVEEIVSEQVAELIRRHPTVDSLEQGFDAAVDFLRQNRRSVLHIYNSVSRDLFEQYLMEMCRYVVTAYVEADFSGQQLAPEDRELLIRYHRCECFGNIIDWLNSGMEEDISAYFHRVYELKRGWEKGLGGTSSPQS